MAWMRNALGSRVTAVKVKPPCSTVELSVFSEPGYSCEGTQEGTEPGWKLHQALRYWVLSHPELCLQVTFRLDTHPAMVTVLEMGAARHFLRMQQLAKTQEERAQLLQPTLEINPRYAQAPTPTTDRVVWMYF